MMSSHRARTGGLGLTSWLLLFFVLVGCDVGRGTGPRGLAARMPRHIIVADSDTTKRTYAPEPCSDPMDGSDNHCAWVLSFAQEETDMMWTATGETTCPDVQRILSSQMMHGRIQKMDLQAALQTSYIFGFSHRYSDPLHPEWSRMHLDARNAFTGQGAVSLTMRHEVMHYLHPELDGQEGQIEALAAACGPY